MAHLRHGERDTVVDAALDAMDAEQLRGLIRALIPLARRRYPGPPDERGREPGRPGVGYFFEPLRELEHMAVDPLPDFDDFLAQWRALVEKRVAGATQSDWDQREDH